ncbi:hypothetical protein MMC25_003935 [Agyrium rufum]|nr:hypothetical protein [Agyrium rufum]
MATAVFETVSALRPSNPGRCYTYPMSHTEELSSPFTIRPEDDRRLASSPAFQIVRKLLANDQSSSFCSNHNPTSPAATAQWLLHRDITYAIILPILHIHRRASELASALLCTHNPFDLELAFRGEARGAFAWLSCLLTEEEDWCVTRGCPACIVSHVLQSEPTIRLVLVAARMSRWLRTASQTQSGHASHIENQESEKESERLPLFEFWRGSLRKALDRDEFWGPRIAKEIEGRAADVELGIMELMDQCCVLERITAQNESPGSESSGSDDEIYFATTGKKECNFQRKRITSACFTPYHRHEDEDEESRIIIKGPLWLSNGVLIGKKEAEIRKEWVRSIMLGCWTTLLADAKAREIAVDRAAEIQSKPVR